MARINLGFPSGRQGLMDDAGWHGCDYEPDFDCADCRNAQCKMVDGDYDYECTLINCEFKEGEPSEDID